jgi:hypothetical protein
MLSTYLAALFLIGLSGLLLDAHRRKWRAAQADHGLTDRDLRFERAQYRRRMQASGIVGALGAAIGIGPMVPHDPLIMVIYLISLVGACGCILLLALLDVVATRQNFARLRSEQLADQVKLAREQTSHER